MKTEKDFKERNVKNLKETIGKYELSVSELDEIEDGYRIDVIESRIKQLKEQLKRETWDLD